MVKKKTAAWKRRGQEKKEPLGAALESYREASNRVGKSHSRPSLDNAIKNPKG
jgi:hypothetical protein